MNQGFTQERAGGDVDVLDVCAIDEEAVVAIAVWQQDESLDFQLRSWHIGNIELCFQMDLDTYNDVLGPYVCMDESSESHLL